MEKLFGILPPLTYVAFLIAETVCPARPLVRVPRWRLKGILFLLIGGIIVNLLPGVWAPWARAHRLLNLEQLPTWAGVLVAIVITDFLLYWAHRLRHRAPLWRFHQRFLLAGHRRPTRRGSFQPLLGLRPSSRAAPAPQACVLG